MKTGIMLVAGGLCVATGVLTLAADSGGIGVGGGEVAEVISTLGYDGVDNIAIHSHGMIAVTLCIIGAAMMVIANAGAWKETDGY